MPLPTSRDRTFISGDDEISAAFLDALQDTAVTAYKPTNHFPPFPFFNRIPSVTDWELDPSTHRFIRCTGDDGFCFVPLALPAGRTIIGAEFRVDGGTAPQNYYVSIASAVDGAEFVNFMSGAVTNSGIHTATINGSHTIGGDRLYAARVDGGTGSGNRALYWISVRFA